MNWEPFVAAFAVLLDGVFLSTMVSCTNALTEKELRGQQFYLVHCSECPDVNQLGLKQEPPKLNGVFSHQILPDDTSATDEAVRQVIIYGKHPMPAFNKRLNDAQVSDLIGYLHTDRDRSRISPNASVDFWG